tara:strand:+ start:2541 stop:3032 length:492 start_codon:yes stop_codon:yes gene_type:complete
MADNLQDALKQSIEKIQPGNRLQKHHILIANRDGICLYSNKEKGKDISMGALLGGVWQASVALLEINKFGVNPGLKLGFDDGENGFCVVAIELAGRPCYACLVFEDEIAPGAVRGQLKRWCDLLADSLESWSAPVTRSGYLFKDVTDEEIDRLFGFGGNECRS